MLFVLFDDAKVGNNIDTDKYFSDFFSKIFFDDFICIGLGYVSAFGNKK